MNARVDWLFPILAEDLGLSVLGSLDGGEFGAILVADCDGREMILKAIPDPQSAPRWTVGVELARVMHGRGYPAPQYFGVGATNAACWSLQERLKGQVPRAMTVAHAHRLVELARSHADAAGRRASSLAERRSRASLEIDRLAERADTNEMALKLRGALRYCEHLELRDADVVHGDFNHGNYLADGDRLTGVFDWESASVGDWRLDLVNLACWSSWVPRHVSADALHVIRKAALDVCPPAVLAFATCLSVQRTVSFYAQVHPERLAWLLPMIDATVSSWWRTVL